MAYADFPISSGDPFRAADLNDIREALSRRGAQIGISPTLPGEISVGSDVGSTFKTWLLAARSCVEEILTESAYYNWTDSGNYTFAAWTKANLLSYVHSVWVAPEGGDPENDWKAYSEVNPNAMKAQYINEIYYACECMCITKPGLSSSSPSRTVKYGAGSSLGGGTDVYMEDAGDIADGTSQSGATSNGNIKYDTVVINANDGTYYIQLGCDAAGDFYLVDGNIGLVSGSINLSTGSFSFEVDTSLTSGNDIEASYTYDYTEGVMTDAINAAASDFDGNSYAGTSGSLTATAIVNYREEPPTSGDYYANNQNNRVTDADVIIPNVAYSLTKVVMSWHHSDGYGAPAPTIGMTGGSGYLEITGSSEGYSTGFLLLIKDSGGWDNESIDPTYYYTDDNLTGVDGWFITYASGSDSIVSEIISESISDSYGETGFNGYSNGEYGMSPI